MIAWLDWISMRFLFRKKNVGWSIHFAPTDRPRRSPAAKQSPDAFPFLPCLSLATTSQDTSRWCHVLKELASQNEVPSVVTCKVVPKQPVYGILSWKLQKFWPADRAHQDSYEIFSLQFFQEEKKIGTRGICFSEERRSNDDVTEIYKCRRCNIKYVKIWNIAFVYR